MERRSANRRLYHLLALVLALAMGYQVCFSISAIQYRRLYEVEVARPFSLQLDSDRFSQVARAMADSGIGPGDQLLEVEHQPYQGGAQLTKVLAGKRPGAALAITVLRKRRAEPEQVTVPL